MKKIITALLLLASTSSFADCREAYELASKRRDIRNEIIVGVVWVGTKAASVILTGGVAAEIVSVSKEFVLAGAWPMAEFKRQGKGIYKNNFDKVLLAFEGTKSGVTNKFLEKILRKTERKLGRVLSELELTKAKSMLAEGFDNGLFCPIAKSRNGKERPAVFNRNGLAEYLAANL